MSAASEGAGLSAKQCPVRVRAFGLRKQKFEVAVRAHRISEQQTLPVGAAEFLQESQLIFTLDTLRDYIQVEVAAHLNDRADNRRIVGVGRHVAYE